MIEYDPEWLNRRFGSDEATFVQGGIGNSGRAPSMACKRRRCIGPYPFYVNCDLAFDMIATISRTAAKKGGA